MLRIKPIRISSIIKPKLIRIQTRQLRRLKTGS
jgi:hypothetical protein